MLIARTYGTLPGDRVPMTLIYFHHLSEKSAVAKTGIKP